MLYNFRSGVSKPRTYRRVARKHYLEVSKKKRKSTKEIRKALKKQLQFVSRDLKLIETLQSDNMWFDKLDKRDKQLLETIHKIYDQQKYMYDNKTHKCNRRIVSLYQPYVRPIVRGKDKSKTEFGSKINVSEVNGFCRIDRFSWESFNEGGDVEHQVERYKILYGCYPLYFLVDGIYMTRSNRRYLKDKGINIVGKPLGRPSKKKEPSSQKYYKKKKAAQRNHVEGKFGQGKRGYGLNCVKARLEDTSESWVNAIFFVMNLTKLMKISFNGKNNLALKLKLVLIKIYLIKNSNLQRLTEPSFN